MANQSNQLMLSIHFDRYVYRALCTKAVRLDCNLSDIVHEALIKHLGEDAMDEAVCEERKNVPSVSFETVVDGLKREGKL